MARKSRHSVVNVRNGYKFKLAGFATSLPRKAAFRRDNNFFTTSTPSRFLENCFFFPKCWLKFLSCQPWPYFFDSNGPCSFPAKRQSCWMGARLSLRFFPQITAHAQSFFSPACLSVPCFSFSRKTGYKGYPRSRVGSGIKWRVGRAKYDTLSRSWSLALNLVLRAFPLKNGWGGKREKPWGRDCLAL